VIHHREEPRQETCEKHGPFTSKNILHGIWSRCPPCSADEATRARADAEAQERRATLEGWQRRIGRAGIPERFQDRSLENFIATTDAQRRALAFATAYADGFGEVMKTGRSALFIGKYGTGKTHLACAIGMRLMQRDQRPVLFSTVFRAVRRVKDTWSAGSLETESQAIAALTFPHLLILDEVGVQHGSDTEKLIVFDLINERYERRRPTLLLSNFDVETVRRYLSERVFDRLREDGGEVVVFNWSSNRGAEHDAPR
jgi:DNA replication protein DnaC